MSERDGEEKKAGGAAGAGAPQDAAAGGHGEPSERRRLLAQLTVQPGLCAVCAHLLLLASPRSVYVRCGLAATDPAFPRYPALPVIRCGGYRPQPGAARATDRLA
jgi:hypothetical protein